MHAQNGGWLDHKTKDSGNFRELCEHLCIRTDDDYRPRPAPRSTQNNIKSNANQKPPRSLAQTPSAKHWRITCDTPAEELERIKRYLSTQRGAGIGHEDDLTIKHAKTALDLLISRRSFDFARASQAEIGVGKWRIVDASGETTDDWQRRGEIQWPFKPSAAKSKTGYQRETRRGGVGKLMSGSSKNVSMFTPARHHTRSNTIVVGEGAQTVAAVWNNVDADALTCFEAGNLSKIDSSLFKDQRWQKIIIAADNDSNEIGNKAAQAAAQRLKTALDDTVTVKIAMPPEVDEDWDDLEDRLFYSEDGDEPSVRQRFAEIFFASLIEPEAIEVRPAEEINPSLQKTNSVEDKLKEKKVFNLDWHRKVEQPTIETPSFVSMAVGEGRLKHLMTVTVANIKSLGAPILVQSTMGTGKTNSIAEALAQMLDKKSPALMSFKTTRERDEFAAKLQLYQLKHGKQVGVHIHEARSTKNCNKWDEIKKLHEAERAPYSNVCLTCPHGERADNGVAKCGYIQSLREAQRQQIVLACHGAVEHDSSLSTYTKPRDDRPFWEQQEDVAPASKTQQRAYIKDERSATDKRGCITQDTITLMLRGCEEVEEEEATKAEVIQDHEQVDEEEIKSKSKKGLTKLEWIAELKEALRFLNRTLCDAPAKGFQKFESSTLSALLVKIPERAVEHDGTIAESVRLAVKKSYRIPRSVLVDLGTALKNETVWIKNQTLIFSVPSQLHARLINEDGILLDATPSLRVRTEYEEAGGQIVKLSVEQPSLKITQFGPQLFGRGYCMTEESQKRYFEILLYELAKDHAKKVAVITHKPLAEAFLKEHPEHAGYVGWWGADDRAHNRWEKCNRLVIFGFQIFPPDEMRIQYEIDRAALEKRGVYWETWDGSVEENAWVEIAGGREIQSALPLPTCRDARNWLLDIISSDTAQAIGRLRAARRADEKLEVSIYGAVPLIGHDVIVHDFKLAPGRAETKAISEASVFAAVAEFPHDRNVTNRAISDEVYAQSGIRLSMTTLAPLIRLVKQIAASVGRAPQEVAVELMNQYRDRIEPMGSDMVPEILDQKIAVLRSEKQTARTRSYIKQLVFYRRFQYIIRNARKLPKEDSNSPASIRLQRQTAGP